MVPAQPPFPTPANLPFQFSRGIQTSNAMCESDVGRISPVTRQNGGRFRSESGAPGGVNAPRVTRSADAIVVFSSFTVASCSHCVGAAVVTRAGRVQASATSIDTTAAAMVRFIRSPIGIEDRLALGGFGPAARLPARVPSERNSGVSYYPRRE